VIEEHEILTLFLGILTLAFGISRRRTLAALPDRQLLVAAYLLLLTGWVSTVLEGFFLPEFLNAVEHLSYTAASTLLAVWSWRARRQPRGSAL
jgi:hypothetical protein